MRITTLLSLLFFSALSQASTTACNSDIARLCAGVEPGEGRVIHCLKNHASQLSPKCRSLGKRVSEKLKEMTETCRKDADKLCQGYPQSGGRAIACLKEKMVSVSASCKSTLDDELNFAMK